ncbi:torsin-1A-like [Branchiostoma lanceolatum]|uniref:torsin-1A-like n=1 Tax=Branchiostoma lanceolatum TaxID=7740 RepID=UPI0034533EFD
MATILLPGASLGPGKNFLPAIERARGQDEFPLPNPPAQFDAENPLSGMTISAIETNLRALCHNANPRLLLGLAGLNDQQPQSWIRLAHFLILRANELHQEPGRLRRLLEWPYTQARARPVVTSAVTVVVLTVLMMAFITYIDDSCGGQFQPNMTRLDKTIQRKLHGQPLVHDIVVRYIKDHVNTASPERALVLSFHGPPGVGKNYVGGMVAESLFLDGLNSPCVRQYIATKHFPHHDPDSIKEYKDKLHRLIPVAVRSCPRTLFIFDETDKMPEGLIDTIKPYVDAGAPVDGQNFNKAMFLFLSNTAASTIIDKFIELRKGGTDRNDYRIKQFEKIVQQSAETTDGTDKKMGMWHAALMKHVHVIPFLPLELKEVEKCIRDVMLDLGKEADLTKEMWDKISDEISFMEKDGVKYSENGCRDVRSKTLLHLEK